MNIQIIFEHTDFVVIDKPPRVLVHSHPRFPNERPMVQRVRDILGKYVWPVHRLDRSTSGCLIMATSQEAVGDLSLALSQGVKNYWAVVRGCVTLASPIEIKTPIKKNKSQYQEAHSTAWCLGSTTEPRSSLLRVHPHTGRNHQIRRHLRDINHPILHDGDHGDSRVNRWWRENYGLQRLALHACEIRLNYYGETHRFQSPFPQDLYSVFEKIAWWKDACQRDPHLQASYN